LAAFYAVTGLAHSAVVVFFVLSGYLIGGPALGRVWAGTWSGRRYVVHRVTRLWTVLVPALALTLIWDAVGHRANAAAYQGAYASLLISGPSATSPAVHGWTVVLGNLLGLQTIVVPVLGSNGPLWSLANETWYYLLGGLLFWSGMLRPRSAVWIGVWVLVAGLCWWLPAGMKWAGCLWFAGALAERWHAWRHPSPRWAWFALGVTAMFAEAIVTLLMRQASSTDWVIGALVAVALPCLASSPPLGTVYARVATWTSDISYTLYLTHFPAAFALYAWLLAPWQGEPNLWTAALFAGGVATLLLYATVLWWLIERRTPILRAWAERRFVPARRVEIVD
jgi:peptidoglycan/LPS O-acetylase OafA/YrhL